MSKIRKQDAAEPSKQGTAGVTGMDSNLDLSQLDTTVKGFNGKTAGLYCRQHRGEGEARRAAFRKKYGAEWKKYYDEWRVEQGLIPHPDCDLDVKLMNESIYMGRRFGIIGEGAGPFMLRQYAHEREVYGDALDRLVSHDPGDPEAVELLLRWAEKTGRWRDLPDCLQGEYHKRVSSQ